MASRLDCIYSTIKNTSGATMTFSWLPPHGRTLASNATVTLFGSAYEAVIQTSADRIAAKRNIDAFINALAQNYVDVIATPNPILPDRAGVPHMVWVNNAGNLALTLPSYNSAAP